MLEEASFQQFHQPEDREHNLPTDVSSTNNLFDSGRLGRGESIQYTQERQNDTEEGDSIEGESEGAHLSENEPVEVATHLHNWRIHHAKGDYKFKGECFSYINRCCLHRLT